MDLRIEPGIPHSGDISDSHISTLLVSTLQGISHDRGQGYWPGVSILGLGEIASLICSFYISVAAGTIVYSKMPPWDALACCLDAEQPTNKNHPNSCGSSISIIIIALKGAIQDFCSLLTAPRTVSKGSARYCRGPLLPQPVIAAINFDIVLEYLDKRTNEPGRLTTTGRRACLQCTGLRVPIPEDVAKTSAGGRPFSLCKRFSRQ